ncbi:nucleotide sugar dehydrogenase [Allonocardiopsis opalescens]|uniref:UDP-N-acetyl-D-mannosaminuronic acid dehydrogenase n=1 Tax=Allonocardiopsis opalescens TaxID=1144618 RepID=A0A2T0QCT8_9ACTN|nr:nucleotide sugar dehydrogenase [Allonocardiopsis opalescens]PRY01766.1 UDP-N-acetyl-D-mannosaminuronic acid dehydrogenase [Allonocardiopsis opalescens]
MRFLRDSPDLTVAVIGFGYVGSCLGVTLAEQGMTVIGIDSDRELIGELERGHCRTAEPGLAEALTALRDSPRLSFTTDYTGVDAADVVIITVGTPVDAEGAMRTEALESVCRQLAPRLRTGQLVILKSTVAPGHTRKAVLPLLEAGGARHGTDFGLAFCPERLSEGGALAQIRKLPIIVGGCDEESTKASSEFWHRALGVPVLEYAAAEVAEIVKLADNWWIDHNIAMASDLARMCDAFGVDVLDVIDGANSLAKGDSYVNILRPSVGVGGSCLTKDPWMAWRAARDRGARLETIETARKVNESMPAYACEMIADGLAKAGKSLDGAVVSVLGIAFKNNTGDLRATPVLPAVAALRAAGAKVTLFDPLADPDEAEKMFGLRPVPVLEEAVRDADCLAVLAGHDPFQRLDFAALGKRVSMPCLVFDGRAYYSRQTIGELYEIGYTYRGIGR